MNTQYLGLITLVKSSITGEKSVLPDNFSLEGVTKLAKKHQIVPLVCEGISVCGLSSEIVRPLMQDYYFHTMVSIRQMNAVQRVIECFDENKIDYLPLKGIHIKSLYPKPEMRVMGDADILIRISQYGKIKPLMLQLGFQEKYESDHELIWQDKNLMVELHKRMIPSYNQDYYRYFQDGWHLAVKDCGTRYTMRPEDEFVYLFTHFSKHYRDGGVGVRQLVDLWVFRRSYPNLEETYIVEKMKELQLEVFYQNICDLLSAWFEQGPWNEKIEFITDFIFDSGVFGSEDSHLVSAGLRDAVQSGSIAQSKISLILYRLFPNAEEMSNRYPILSKAPWLKPLFWPIRWISALLFRRDNINKLCHNMEAATPDKIRNMQEALKYVGLEFHFDE